ncbi:MAG: hypothetical protein ACTTK5_01395 [Candidatus Fimenecus sp.]
MTKKEELQSIRRINFEIKHKRSRITALKSILTSVTHSYNPDVVQGVSVQDKMAKFVAEINDLETEIKDLEKTLLEIKNTVFDNIKQLESPEFEILYKRYFEFKSFKKIADELCYSERQIFRFHNSGMKNSGVDT